MLYNQLHSPFLPEFWHDITDDFSEYQMFLLTFVENLNYILNNQKVFEQIEMNLDKMVLFQYENIFNWNIYGCEYNCFYRPLITADIKAMLRMNDDWVEIIPLQKVACWYTFWKPEMNRKRSRKMMFALIGRNSVANHTTLLSERGIK